MFTNIYQNSLLFRLMAVAVVIFVLTATSLPLGYGFTSSVYAQGEEPPEEPMEEPPEEPMEEPMEEAPMEEAPMEEAPMEEAPMEE
ncbi:uncharacterized protein METZ01_LOCUS410520, partial [marine metagenome]